MSSEELYNIRFGIYNFLFNDGSLSDKKLIFIKSIPGYYYILGIKRKQQKSLIKTKILEQSNIYDVQLYLCDLLNRIRDLNIYCKMLRDNLCNKYSFVSGYIYLILQNFMTESNKYISIYDIKMWLDIDDKKAPQDFGGMRLRQLYQFID